MTLVKGTFAVDSHCILCFFCHRLSLVEAHRHGCWHWHVLLIEWEQDYSIVLDFDHVQLAVKIVLALGRLLETLDFFVGFPVILFNMWNRITACTFASPLQHALLFPK